MKDYVFSIIDGLSLIKSEHFGENYSISQLSEQFTQILNDDLICSIQRTKFEIYCNVMELDLRWLLLPERKDVPAHRIRDRQSQDQRWLSLKNLSSKKD